MTLEPMVELMLGQTAIARNLRDNTVKAYRARLVAIGAKSDWTKDEAQTAVDSVQAINTRNLTAIAVKTVLELDVRLTPVVAHDWELPTVEQLTQALEGFRFATRAWIMAVTSCRLAEACAVTRSSIAGNQLVIDSQVDNEGNRLPTKTKAHVKTIPAWLAKRIAELDSVDSPAAVRSALARLSKQHELQLNASCLRSFSANYLLRNQIDLHTVSKQLGHASITTTSNFYAQADRLRVASVLDQLNPDLERA